MPQTLLYSWFSHHTPPLASVRGDHHLLVLLVIMYDDDDDDDDDDDEFVYGV